MPAKRREKPLYQRGKYALYPREGRNLEIIWYDEERKRERSVSAGTSDVQTGIKALDRRYLNDTSERLCPTCQRPWDHVHSPLVSQAIADYLILKEGTAGYDSSRHRLAHVVDYLARVGAETRCSAVDEAWIAKFRDWASQQPILGPSGAVLRRRSAAHVEGSVMQLAAAINKVPGQSALFAARQQIKLSHSPVYRADVETLASMFRHALADPLREHLLAYLRLAVASWGRPEAILGVKRDQWHSAPRVLDMKPRGEAQTTKRRPMLPMPRQIVPHLDAMGEHWIPTSTIRNSWDKMRRKLGLPDNREAGPKLIRRTMSTLVRDRIGEEHWRQGEIWLGHVEMTISDIYAIPKPSNLGLALKATEEIIDEIEALAPGSYRKFTAIDGNKQLAEVSGNG